ncbi:uncharacterized [Tachysurus ichikawai]
MEADGNNAESHVINHACEMEIVVESEEKVDADFSFFAALPKLLCFSRCSAIIIFRSLNIVGHAALSKDVNQEAAENLAGMEIIRGKEAKRTKDQWD